jgi:hypothetical protein
LAELTAHQLREVPSDKKHYEGGSWWIIENEKIKRVKNKKQKPKIMEKSQNVSPKATNQNADDEVIKTKWLTHNGKYPVTIINQFRVRLTGNYSDVPEDFKIAISMTKNKSDVLQQCQITSNTYRKYSEWLKCFYGAKTRAQLFYEIGKTLDHQPLKDMAQMIEKAKIRRDIMDALVSGLSRAEVEDKFCVTNAYLKYHLQMWQQKSGAVSVDNMMAMVGCAEAIR